MTDRLPPSLRVGPRVVTATLVVVAMAGLTGDASALDIPGAPSGLTVQVTGTTVVLSWNPSAGEPTTYVVEAGWSPGTSDVARIITGNLATGFTAVGVPNGTYFGRVRAANSAGASAPSNEITIVVGHCAVPRAPDGLTVTVAGTVVRLGWIASLDSLAFIVEAGSAPGLSNLFNQNIGRPRFNDFVASAPPGVYYVRVRGVNVCGVSTPSNEVMVIVTARPGVTLGFAALPVGPFDSTMESGFSIRATAAAWRVIGYGNPAPAIVFDGVAGQTVLGELRITADGLPFTFASVDVYSSVTPIPYLFVGILNGSIVFTTTGTVPNTFGRFATVTNPFASASIDTLLIRLTNPQIACCGQNPMGIDNVVLVP